MYLEVDVASLHSVTRSDPDVGLYTKIISIHIEGWCSEIQEESSTRSRLSKIEQMNRDYLDVDGASLHSLRRSHPDVGLYANIKLIHMEGTCL